MSRKSTVVYEFSSGWCVLKELREKLQSQLSETSEDVSDAVIMASSELVENAIKYGDSNFTYRLKIQDEGIEIEVINNKADGSNIVRLRDHIDKIRKSENPFDLYTERLLELMNNPQNGPTQLGLIRIAYEGRFDLSCREEDKMICITAKRKTDSENESATGQG
ncbi:MAG: hypothetical protein QNJ97_13250 [Myxococcota bacterium]|nr:hypothetical protein [Myxococcota bacterium]